MYKHTYIRFIRFLLIFVVTVFLSTDIFFDACTSLRIAEEGGEVFAAQRDEELTSLLQDVHHITTNGESGDSSVGKLVFFREG